MTAVLFGFGEMALSLRLRAVRLGELVAKRVWPRWLRLIGTTVVLLLAVAGGVISAAVDREAPTAPGAFYTPPSPLPAGPPGTTIIRSEVIAARVARRSWPPVRLVVWLRSSLT